MTIDMHAHYAPQELVTELCKRNIPPFIKENDNGTIIDEEPAVEGQQETLSAVEEIPFSMLT